MEALLQLVSRVPVERGLAVTFSALARVGPFVFLVPAFGGQALPATVRTVAALGLSALCWPVAWRHASAFGPDSMILVLLVAREALVGLTLGLLVALLFHAFEAAGRITDTLRGSQMASVASIVGQDPSSPLGTFLLLFSVATFVSLDGHILLLEALAETYRILPPGLSGPTRPQGILHLLVDMGARYFELAIGLAAPLLATAFLVDLIVGLVGRAVPQLPSYFVALPLKAWLTLLILFLALPLLMRILWLLSGKMAALVLVAATAAAG